MYKDKIQVKVKCPNHPNYGPAKGLGAIKANCRFCWDIYNLGRQFDELRKLIKKAEGEFGNVVSISSFSKI